MLEVQAGRFREDLYYRLYVVPIELPPLRDRGEDVLLIARHFLAQFSKEEERKFRGLAPDAEAALLAYAWPGNVRQLQNVVRNVVVLHRDGEWVDAAMLPPPVVRFAALGLAAPPLAAPPLAAPQIATPIVAAPIAAPPPFAPPPVAPRAVMPPPEPAIEEREPVWEPAAAVAVAERVRAAPFRPAPPAPAPVAPPPSAAPEDADIVPLAVMERRLILAALRRTNGDVPRAAALLQINPSTVYRKLQSWRADGLGDDA
jgi:two-component system repressor protein LuxO